MMNYENKKIIVSVSGGKDSTAMCLNLLEKGFSKHDFICVFADTGWEHQSTYDYLNKLEKTIGKIERVKSEITVKEEHKEIIEQIEFELGFESPMIRRIIKNHFFPNRFQKWCTTDLKIKPIKKFFDSLEEDFLNLVGIRKEESPRRSKMKEWEYNDFFDCWVHRPLINWTEKEVIDIHHRFNLSPNKLYLNGSSRVGCYPCINSRKREIKLLDQNRIDIIRKLEQIINKIDPRDDLKHTFFSSKNGMIMNIDQVYEWSKTTRGGKQLELFSMEEPTCVKWGMCDFGS